MASKNGTAGKRGDAAAIFAAGSCSGMITSSVLQPLDVIKTHLMAEHHAGRTGNRASPLSSSFAMVVREIVRKEGILSLWRGTGPTVLRVGLGAGLYFLMLDRVMTGMRTLHETRQQAAHTAALERETFGRPAPVEQDRGKDTLEVLVSPQQELREIEQLLPSEASTSGRESGTSERQAEKRAEAGGSLPALYTMTAGAVTRSTAAALLCPVTVVKTRMEYSAVTGHVYRNTFHAVESIFRTEGVRGLFSGLGPTLLRDAPYSGLYLLMYDKTRRGLRDLLPASTSQVYINFMSGGLAGGGATLATHPPDVVRTRLQLSSSGNRRGALATARHIVQTEGVSSLFAGITPRVAKRAMQMALTWSLYEELTRIFVKRSIWGSKEVGRQGVS
ncbi:mitochondrial substrate carrier family protein [Klebsormidium nitens]|uniref:Mitochondrial substrate carrier family protein n=1 Tax=Klebsormidium nitens TaxID=105231 RepID=A0A1Y1IJ75_KLENI|nr:mitochondrial substrate carrier family protein [Klebsormidium nitens]|eukprot:GAQ90172.1 mitochondrial substrate carrier family protein [Klebsormidium nitens]